MGWLGLVGLDERQQQLRRAQIAGGGAIDQLLDRGVELGAPPAAHAYTGGLPRLATTGQTFDALSDLARRNKS